MSPKKSPVPTDETQRKGGVKTTRGLLWTARQRQAARLHEIAYRACFKPALPAYFISRYSREGDVVYDPFSGRGTTVIEAALNGRNIISNDVNPISSILIKGRLAFPDRALIAERLQFILKQKAAQEKHDLAMFFHKKTLDELITLRNYLQDRKISGTEDAVDDWIRMVATNRLTGHSSGFFSVYTLPPNQAVSRERQKKINAQRGQKPEYRDVSALIIKRSRILQSGLSNTQIDHIRQAATTARFYYEDAAKTSAIKKESVQLTVTSPPFLDIVQYARDNWLRCWFNCIDEAQIAPKITMSHTVEEWVDVMQKVFHELYRITKPGGYVAFETGEVRKGKVFLDTHVLTMGERAGFTAEKILINTHAFTKTANIWGVHNNTGGTNSNRIVLFQK